MFSNEERKIYGRVRAAYLAKLNEYRKFQVKVPIGQVHQFSASMAALELQAIEDMPQPEDKRRPDAKRAERAQVVWDFLNQSPFTLSRPSLSKSIISRPALHKAMGFSGIRETSMRRAVDRALDDLIADGRVRSTGSGYAARQPEPDFAP